MRIRRATLAIMRTAPEGQQRGPKAPVPVDDEEARACRRFTMPSAPGPPGRSSDVRTISPSPRHRERASSNPPPVHGRATSESTSFARTTTCSTPSTCRNCSSPWHNRSTNKQTRRKGLRKEALSMSRSTAPGLIATHKSRRPPAHLRRRAPESQGGAICTCPQLRRYMSLVSSSFSLIQRLARITGRRNTRPRAKDGMRYSASVPSSIQNSMP